MTEHLTPEAIARYRAGTISPEDLLELDDHVQVCRDCLERLSEPGRLAKDAAFLRQNLTEVDVEIHPFYEELAAYVDEDIDEVDAEVMKSHLALCTRCAKEVRDLIDFKAEVAQKTKTEEPSPSGTPRRSYLWLAAAAALVGFAILILPRRAEIEDLRSQLAEARSESEKIRTEYESLQSDVRELEAQLRERESPPPPSPPPVERLVDGGRTITRDAGGNLKGLDRLPSSYQEIIQRALTTRKVEISSLVGALLQGAGSLRGQETESAFEVLRPVGTLVRSDRPTFQWSPLEGASQYKVSVYDMSFRRVAESPPLRETEWTPEEPFERATVYQWQVEAEAEGTEAHSPVPPAPPARFQVLGRIEDSELAEAEERYGSSHLLMALLDARAGLLDEAEHELRLLRQQNPESPIVSDLVRSISSLRGSN